MKSFIALFALIAAASAGHIATNYAPEAEVLSVHESHAPLVTTLHHHGVAAAGSALAYSASAASTYNTAFHAPAAASFYSAPAYGFGHGYGYGHGFNYGHGNGYGHY